MEQLILNILYHFIVDKLLSLLLMQGWPGLHKVKGIKSWFYGIFMDANSLFCDLGQDKAMGLVMG
jgi:hypothetical protein